MRIELPRLFRVPFDLLRSRQVLRRPDVFRPLIKQHLDGDYTRGVLLPESFFFRRHKAGASFDQIAGPLRALSVQDGLASSLDQALPSSARPGAQPSNPYIQPMTRVATTLGYRAPHPSDGMPLLKPSPYPGIHPDARQMPPAELDRIAREQSTLQTTAHLFQLQKKRTALAQVDALRMAYSTKR